MNLKISTFRGEKVGVMIIDGNREDLEAIENVLRAIFPYCKVRQKDIDKAETMEYNQ